MENTHRTIVSIVTPSYNCGRYLRTTIDSVLAQTYQDWEMLIVDDGSTDNSVEIINSYDDERIKLLRMLHIGAAEARNMALREAKGKYVAFLDSDDVWLPEKLEKQVAFMQENDYDFSYAEYYKMTQEGERIPQIVSGPARVSKNMMYMYCWPGCLTVMFNREKVGLVQIPNLMRNNDYAIWLRIAHKAECHLLKEPLAVYRLRYNSISRQSYSELIKWHYKLYRIGENMNILSAYALTSCNLFFGIIKKILYQKHDTSGAV